MEKLEHLFVHNTQVQLVVPSQPIKDLDAHFTSGRWHSSRRDFVVQGKLMISPCSPANIATLWSFFFIVHFLSIVCYCFHFLFMIFRLFLFPFMFLCLGMHRRISGVLCSSSPGNPCSQHRCCCCSGKYLYNSVNLALSLTTEKLKSPLPNWHSFRGSQ